MIKPNKNLFSSNTALGPSCPKVVCRKLLNPHWGSVSRERPTLIQQGQNCFFRAVNVLLKTREASTCVVPPGGRRWGGSGALLWLWKCWRRQRRGDGHGWGPHSPQAPCEVLQLQDSPLKHMDALLLYTREGELGNLRETHLKCFGSGFANELRVWIQLFLTLSATPGLDQSSILPFPSLGQRQTTTPKTSLQPPELCPGSSYPPTTSIWGAGQRHVDTQPPHTHGTDNRKVKMPWRRDRVIVLKQNKLGGLLLRNQ